MNATANSVSRTLSPRSSERGPIEGRLRVRLETAPVASPRSSERGPVEACRWLRLLHAVSAISALTRPRPHSLVADAHRDDGKRFVVRADEKTAFMELESFATKHVR